MVRNGRKLSAYLLMLQITCWLRTCVKCRGLYLASFACDLVIRVILLGFFSRVPSECQPILDQGIPTACRNGTWIKDADFCIIVCPKFWAEDCILVIYIQCWEVTGVIDCLVLCESLWVILTRLWSYSFCVFWFDQKLAQHSFGYLMWCFCGFFLSNVWGSVDLQSMFSESDQCFITWLFMQWLSFQAVVDWRFGCWKVLPSSAVCSKIYPLFFRV
jgi:hypothetical protein